MPPSASQPEVTYAVGDIHGRLDLLGLALTGIERHSRGLRSRIVFLGDYIDRGPDSRGVVERLMQVQREAGAICLKGNHEDLMVRAFTESRSTDFSRWRACGSAPTLLSYGVAAGDDPMAIVPRDHIRWLAQLPLTTADPGRIYVHAGLMPNKPFREQTEATFLWIREAFLRARAKDFDVHVIHGHSPLWEGKPNPAQPELHDHRTNLDTAAFATGVLSVGVFEVMSPSGGPAEVLAIRGAPSLHPVAEIIGPSDPGGRPDGRNPAGWAGMFGRSK